MLTRREVLAQLGALLSSSAFQPYHWRPRASDPLLGTIAEFQAGRSRGEWTAAQITQLALDRCFTQGTKWRAIDVVAGDALATAHASDARARSRRLHGALDGVPLFAKSIYDVKGLPTTGSNGDWARLFPESVAHDAIEVARVRSAGAVILGKTAADDFAYHGNGTSSYSGQVLNPHDPGGTRSPGGSSAGSAVAASAGLAFAGLGTDDGGSNRIPAQFTGVVGVKPTFGLVPRTGVIPTWPYLDTHGVMARSVADAAAILAVTAGADHADPLARSRASNDRRSPQLRDEALRSIRLGIVDAHVPRAQMNADAIACWDRVESDLRLAGAEVDSFTPSVTTLNYRAAFTAAASARGDVAPNSRSPAATANALYRYFGNRSHDALAMMRRGYDAYRALYDVLPLTFDECTPLRAQPLEHDAAGQSFARSRATVIASLAASMQAAGIVAMVYPTMPFNATPVAAQWPNIRTALGYGNWLGLPEVSVPAGMGADGMPVLNLSIVGLPGEDARVLALAHAYERQSRRFVAAFG